MTPEREASYVPGESVVWCERCGRWSKRGQPYVMVTPGRFTHRLCAAPALPGERADEEDEKP